MKYDDVINALQGDVLKESMKAVKKMQKSGVWPQAPEALRKYLSPVDQLVESVATVITATVAKGTVAVETPIEALGSEYVRGLGQVVAALCAMQYAVIMMRNYSVILYSHCDGDMELVTLILTAVPDMVLTVSPSTVKIAALDFIADKANQMLQDLITDARAKNN